MDKPAYLIDLETYYGAPSQEGFGSAVFLKKVKTADDLEEIAQEQYQYFVGDKWEEWGPETWLAPWKEVYRRPSDGEHDIIAELNAIDDFQVKMQVDMILNNIENAAEAQQALAAAYDDAALSDLRAYLLGDGEAMSGLLLAGRRSDSDSVFLVFLMD